MGDPYRFRSSALWRQPSFELLKALDKTI
jgi:hypothetical protein